MSKKSILVFLKSNLSLIIVLLLGALAWSVTMVKSGWIYPFGMGFWGANGHDGIWHIALINNFAKGVINVPVFAGYVLQNYHIGFDLLVAFLFKITRVPVVNLYFQILPPIFAFLIGFLTYKFVLLLTDSKKSGVLAAFFTFFGGSFAWVVGKGESAFWSQQQISTLVNPPYALSLIFILLGLIALIKYQNTRKISFLAFSSICFGLLIEIKVYAGVLILGGLLVSGIWRKLKEKKWDFLIVFACSLAVSLIIFMPSLKGSSKLVVWQPFWFLETMMGATDRLNWVRFYSAMTTYKSGGVFLKGILAYSVAFVIFIVGNFATRLLAFKNINLKKLTSLDLFFWSVILAGIIIPTFFLQKGTPWNTIQFFYYSLFFSGILAGIFVAKLNKWILVLVVALTIPTTIISLKDIYLPGRPPAMLSNEELSALKFLGSQPDGIVLTYPFDVNKAKEAEVNPPRPLYLYESTSYVSAFSGKTTFLEDEVNLDITGYDWRTRRKEIESWYKETNKEKARGFLKGNGIEYVYWIKPQRAFLGEGQLGLIRIFENSHVDVYQTEK
jgi:hypothetical protein